jgi:hypothetical protein
MNYREIKKQLKSINDNTSNWDLINEPDGDYWSNFLGSYMSLDPCGKYHHFLSPNGVTKKCNQFWENLDRAASELNCWIESGEGDPCDIFLCKLK